MGDDAVGLKVVEALKKTELEGLDGLEVVDAGVVDAGFGLLGSHQFAADRIGILFRR